MIQNNPILKMEKLVKSKKRVSDHGEVFTPSHIVEEMLDLVKDESERIDSRFLEPACGEGNFLKQVLRRKLTTVQARYSGNEFERNHYALFSLMCIYGIELLDDNAHLCRQNLLSIFMDFITDPRDIVWKSAAEQVLKVNIVQADALTMKTPKGESLTFAEWGYLGKGKFQRRDFEYDNLTQRSSFTGTLFEGMRDEIFTPNADYAPMTVLGISAL